ncbi:MAG: 5-(carboxyamino)imidazole ribonucleotide mutase [Chloroflexi bacterium]|nr:5-(carboxyamino)imidazole ribonucleotide mutase [Chloroflexota bacterium]
MPRVAIITGSQSDIPVLEPCLQTLTDLGIEHELQVMSAHRTPDKVQRFAAAAADQGFEVIIAAAGMAAHLPGVVAAWTPLPVIGVPVGKPGMSGLDALLSIVQMPPGVPVACMAVNGAKNAALYAAAILALKHSDVRRPWRRTAGSSRSDDQRPEPDPWLAGALLQYLQQGPVRGRATGGERGVRRQRRRARLHDDSASRRPGRASRPTPGDAAPGHRRGAGLAGALPGAEVWL